MASSLGILLFLAGVIGFLALALSARASERALDRRVGLITRVPLRKASRGGPGQAPLWRARASDGLRSLFAFRMRRSWGVSANPLYLLALGISAAVSVWLLGRVAVYLPGYFRAIGAVVAFFLLPRIILAMQRRRSDAQFAEELPDAIDMVVRIVRAGLPIANAIRTVGQEANPPLNTVFAAVADQTEIGVPLDKAMATTSEKVGNPDFRFFAVAVALQQATGGNLAETLETLGEIIRKRRAVRMKARAATAEVRISAIVLGAIPVFVTAALLVAAPTYLDPLFSDPRGNVILGAAVLGLFLAGFTMRAMIRNSLRT